MTALVPLDCTGIAALVPSTPFKRVCAQCGSLATRLCDYRPGRGLPCDMLLCDHCATASASGGDLCSAHAPISKFRSDMHARAEAQRESA